jgi:hypothetical protein
MEPHLVLWSCLSGETFFIVSVMRWLALNLILLAHCFEIPTDIIIPYEQVPKYSLSLHLHTNILHTCKDTPCMLLLTSIWSLLFVTVAAVFQAHHYVDYSHFSACYPFYVKRDVSFWITVALIPNWQIFTTTRNKRSERRSRNINKW